MSGMGSGQTHVNEQLIVATFHRSLSSQAQVLFFRTKATQPEYVRRGLRAGQAPRDMPLTVEQEGCGQPDDPVFLTRDAIMSARTGKAQWWLWMNAMPLLGVSA